MSTMMKSIIITFIFFVLNAVYAQDVFDSQVTCQSSQSKYLDDFNYRVQKRKNTDTLKLIFERIDSLYLLMAKQEEKIASEYKGPMQTLKSQHLNDSTLLLLKSFEISNLNKKINELNDLLKTNDQEVTRLTKDILSLNNEISSKQELINQLAQKINLQIGGLKNGSYTMDPFWIDKLINTCNQMTDKSKITNFTWLNDFKAKSLAITIVMNKIQTFRFLNNLDLEKLKQYLEKAYGTENPNFTQLKTDYQRSLSLLSLYTDAFCDVSENIDNVIEMITYKTQQRIDHLVAKSYESILRFPILQTIISEVIKNNFTVNPLKTKINCEL